MLYAAAPSLKTPKAHMKTEEGTSADGGHQFPYQSATMVLDMEAAVAPQNVLSLRFLNPTEMLRLSKSQPKHFQMTTFESRL